MQSIIAIGELFRAGGDRAIGPRPVTSGCTLII